VNPRTLLLDTLRPYRRPLVAASACTVAATAAALAGPYLVKRGIDGGVLERDTSVLWQSVALVVVAAVVGAVAQWGAERLAGRVAESAVYDLRLRLWRHVQTLAPANFENETTGTVLARATADVDAVSELFSTATLTVGPLLLLMAGTAVALVVLDPVLSLVVLASVPVLVVATRLFRRWSAVAYGEVRGRTSAVVAHISESLAGIPVLQAFCREPANQAAFEELNGRLQDAKLRTVRLGAGYGPFAVGLGNVCLFLVLVVGAFRALDGATTVGTIAAFVLYLRQFFNPLQDLSFAHDAFQAASAGLERIAALLDTPPALADPAGAAPLEEGPGHLRLDGVSFGYGDRPVLKDVGLEVTAGETLALMGPTGAGKSTLARLVARAYDPDAGRVALDGRDLRHIRLAELHRAVLVLPQEPFLFRATVAENIALGRPDAEREEVVAAARAVGADGFIARLADGYDSDVGPRGSLLSAGERQLVSLARLFLVAPRVVVLDEATSTLDLPAERVVLGALGRLLAGRTAVVISHRLTVLDLAERVAVVEDGRIVEVGDTDALLARGGRLAALRAGWRGP